MVALTSLPNYDVLLDELHLEKGAHNRREDGLCIMEAAAWLAGQEHTDAPACVSPVLRSFLTSWNDSLDDDTRQRLKPYAWKVLGTAGDPVADERRAWMATDWLVRVHTPAWLRLAGLTSHADALAGLPEVTNGAQVPSIKPALEAARKDAAAAWAAVWDAAGDAVWDAAGDAAWAAAGDAAWAAAGAALAPTVTELQASAFVLLDRMVEAA